MNNGSLKKWKAAVLKNKTWLLLAAGGLIIVGFALKGGTVLSVSSATVEKGTVRKIIESTATVESRNSRTVQSRISGEVIEVFKATGDRVEKGTVLAVVDVQDVNLTIKGLEAQKASLLSTMADADQPTQDALRRAEAQMKSDAVALEAAKRAYDQIKTLFSAGGASEEALKAAEEEMVKAEQTAVISEAGFNTIKNGLTPNQRARFLSDIAAIQAQIDQVRVNRDRFKIVSPIAGVVTLKNVETGQLVVLGSSIFEINDTDNVLLSADLLVQDAARIETGAPVRAFDEDSGIEVTGTITKIEPKAFSKLSDLGIEQKRVRIEMGPDKAMPSLRIGMELDLEVIEKHKENVLILPDSAVFKINTEPHVFLINNGIAVLTPIKTGIEGKDTIEIIKGVQAADTVIDAPGNDLKDGMKVTVNP